jgi:hypothetical protein
MRFVAEVKRRVDGTSVPPHVVDNLSRGLLWCWNPLLPLTIRPPQEAADVVLLTFCLHTHVAAAWHRLGGRVRRRARAAALAGESVVLELPRRSRCCCWAGSDDDNLFQWPNKDLLAQLDRLAAAGGNVIRNTMSDRRDKGFEVYPFARREDGKYDLNQWNDEYWTASSGCCGRRTGDRSSCRSKIWDRFDYTDNGGADHWQISPLQPQEQRQLHVRAVGIRRAISRSSRRRTSSRSSSPRPSSGTTRSCSRFSSGS